MKKTILFHKSVRLINLFISLSVKYKYNLNNLDKHTDYKLSSVPKKECEMKFKQLLSLMFLSSSILLADNFRNQLIIPCVNVNNPYWEFSHQIISEREEGDFAKLVTKWNETLVKICTKLDGKIHEEINASIPQIDYYLNDQRFVDVYLNCYKQAHADIMNKEVIQDIDEIVLNFIKLKFNYLQFYKPVKTSILEKELHLCTS